jgi:hypothetical protein
MGLWRNLFGPGQNEVWGDLARQIGADFTEAGWFKRGRVDLHAKNHTITLDTFDVGGGETSSTYTRMRAPFRNGSGLTMNIFRDNTFARLGKLVGMQDIVIGDAFFDNAFVIQGQPEARIKAFLQDAKLRELIRAQPRIAFQVAKGKELFSQKYPDGIDDLQFLCAGVVKDAQRLKLLFEMFARAIDRLTEIDLGCRFDVQVTPK